MWDRGKYCPVAYFVTAALEGRQYRYEGNASGFGSNCSSTLVDIQRNASLTEVCAVKNINSTSVDQWGTVAVDNELKRSLTYEDAKSFRYKFCTMKKKLLDVKYGIIAVSINTDDTANICGKGEYHRLKTLRALVDFFKNDFKSEADVDKCIKGES